MVLDFVTLKSKGRNKLSCLWEKMQKMSIKIFHISSLTKAHQQHQLKSHLWVAIGDDEQNINLDISSYLSLNF